MIWRFQELLKENSEKISLIQKIWDYENLELAIATYAVYSYHLPVMLNSSYAHIHDIAINAPPENGLAS